MNKYFILVFRCELVASVFNEFPDKRQILCLHLRKYSFMHSFLFGMFCTNKLVDYRLFLQSSFMRRITLYDVKAVERGAGGQIVPRP